ncbi:MAG: DUF6174 domain-containing protein [Bacteroidota bacterium]
MIRLVTAMGLLASFAACAAPAPDPQLGPVPVTGNVETPELDAAIAKWESTGMDDYTMTVRRTCFCPVPDYTGPFQVTVRTGELAEVSLDGSIVEAERGATVASLFDLLRDAYDRQAETVMVEYHPDLGYPISISIDYDTRMADEEIGYTVTDFSATTG